MSNPQTLSQEPTQDTIENEASSLPFGVELIFTLSVFFVLIWGFSIVMRGNPPDREPGSKGFREPSVTPDKEEDLASTHEPEPDA